MKQVTLTSGTLGFTDNFRQYVTWLLAFENVKYCRN